MIGHLPRHDFLDPMDFHFLNFPWKKNHRFPTFFHISVDSSKQSKSLLSHLLTSSNCVSPSFPSFPYHFPHHFPIIFPIISPSFSLSFSHHFPQLSPPFSKVTMFQAFEGNGLDGAMGGHLQTWRLWQCHLVGENAGKKWEKRWKKWDKPEEFLEHLVKLWVKSGKHVIRKNEGKDVGTYGNMLGTNWMIIGWTIY